MKDNLKSVDSLIEKLTAEQREELENNPKPLAQKKTEQHRNVKDNKYAFKHISTLYPYNTTSEIKP